MRQGEGLGGLLIRESIQSHRRLAGKRILLVGDAPYYSRFGFQKLSDVIMPHPTNPDACWALRRVEMLGGLKGAVEKSEI